MVWLYVVWREHCFLWPGLIHLSYHMAVPCKARELLPLAWDTSYLPSYGCTFYGASIIAFGLDQFVFVIIWPYAIWCDHYCLWPGLAHLCHHVAVHRLARVFLPLAWVNSSLLSYGHTPYGASIIAFSLGYLMFATVRRYVVWREYYYCLWPGLIHLWVHMAVCRMARVLMPLA